MLTGHTLKNQYRIYDRVGMGGAATVYLARDVGSGQMVVVKVVHPHLVSEKFIARFEREIDLLQQIDSPYIIKLFDWGLREEDAELNEIMSYIVAEFVQGHTLADIIDTRGKLEESTALAIARQLALALEEVHGKGIVHRDVKAQNIMITPENDAKLIDFGIAKGPDHATLTDPSHFAGTLFYAPPEQIMGASAVDHRADLYALGIVLYEMLMGHLPIQDREFGVIANRVIKGDLDPISDVSEEVETLVNEMIATNADERIASARDIVDRIESIVGTAAPDLPERPPALEQTGTFKRIESGEIPATPADTMPLDSVTPGYGLETETGRQVLIEQVSVIIGRSHPRDPVAPDIDLNSLGLADARTASRKHCRLFVEDGEYYVEDLGSMNGTWVNDTRLEPGNIHAIFPGDVISTGKVRLTFKAI